MSTPSPETPSGNPQTNARVFEQVPASKRMIVEIFGDDFAPFVVGGLALFAGFGGAGLFAMGIQAGSPAAGAVAALGAFAAGLGGLALLLRKS